MRLRDMISARWFGRKKSRIRQRSGCTPPPSVPRSVESLEAIPLEAVQRIVVDVLAHNSHASGITVKQLASRCRLSCQLVFEAARELQRLGYVNCAAGTDGHMRIRRHYYRQSVNEHEPDPIEVHIRIIGPMLHRGPVTERQLVSRCCELSKEVRRNTLKELVEADCLEPCFDCRGIPAFRVTSTERAERGLTMIREAKDRERTKAGAGRLS